MFRFLFGGRNVEDVVAESQREELERLTGEFNKAMDALPEKPKLIIDPATGHLALDLPETLPDEALALPAPTKEPVADPVGGVQND